MGETHESEAKMKKNSIRIVLRLPLTRGGEAMRVWIIRPREGEGEEEEIDGIWETLLSWYQWRDKRHSGCLNIRHIHVGNSREIAYLFGWTLSLGRRGHFPLLGEGTHSTLYWLFLSFFTFAFIFGDRFPLQPTRGLVQIFKIPIT